MRCTWPSDKLLRIDGAVFSLDGTESVKESLVAELATEVDIEDVNAEGDLADQGLTGIIPPSKCPLLLKRYKTCARLGLQIAEALNKSGANVILSAIKAAKAEKEIAAKEAREKLKKESSGDEPSSAGHDVETK